MRYLFFDIECANCDNGLGKICSFGYVICDTNFNVIKKEDILMNPNSKFSYGISCNKYITLGYPLKEFTSQPKFDYFYPQIKELLMYPDQIVIGHAVANDVNFLLGEYERYGLPLLKYDFYDSQELYRLIKNNTQHKSLITICEELDIEIGVVHRSDEDALMTSKIASKLCENANMDLLSLFDKYPTCKHKMDSAIAKYNKRKTHSLYKQFLKVVTKQHKQHRNNDAIKNKTFCFSRKIETQNLAKMAQLIQIIIDLGGHYTYRADKCDYFIRTRSSCDRLYKVKLANKEFKQNIQIISFTEFQKMSKVKWAKLPELDMLNYIKTINSYKY